MTQENMPENDTLDPRFLEKSYQEAMALTQDVANYLESESKNLRDLTENSEVCYASETMRVSTCLMQVMSWFLVQKAVISGEITKKQARASKFRLGAYDVCLAKINTKGEMLPEEFVIFMNKAQNLYRQVVRMEQMYYGNSDAANPVHDLFGRIKSKE